MINDITNEMRQFLTDIKENIKNPEELHYLLQRTEKLYDVILTQMERLTDYKVEEMNEIRNIQKKHHDRIDEMEEKIKQLSIDVYDEELEEFENNCPYCNYTFDADIDDNVREIVCPECNNIIELDWNQEDDE